MMNTVSFNHYIDDSIMMSNTQLETAINKFSEILKKRKEIEREELRQELMENLQKALSDILHNDFYLIIKNTERNHEDDDYDEVVFNPEDIYSIKIQQRQRYFFNFK